MSEGAADHVGQAYLQQARRRLAASRDQIRHCLEQLDDRQVWWRPHESMNSIANLLLHLCGNLRQWIVSGVGGSLDSRDRPQEFAERGALPKAELLRRLEEVIAVADAVLAQATQEQLLAPRRIQGFEETGLSAIFASLAHLSGHVQEIICMTRLQRGDAYRFAWAPATPEQGAPRQEVPGIEAFAIHPAESPVVKPSDEKIHPDSPLRDPLLELEQEFQDQEEEGKL